ncbi:MAG: trimeric intracellular cation channel family protein [Proteobacteria bacterium]|nr:trimeric intracellular cation channel family protein [Pseudomonadota bacterium]
MTAPRGRAVTLLLVADLAGSFVFALEGGLRAIGARLDLLGVMVLAGVTAFGGGMIRDVLIGAVPPAALRDARYPALALLAGGLAFALHPLGARLPDGLLLGLDAAGLGLFAVAGVEKSLRAGLPPLVAVLLGTITAVGGGTTRDMLLGQVPAVLRVDFYATAALAGSAVMVGARALGLPARNAAILGGATCFVLRMVSARQGWQLPVAGP